jgi:hypothetical protein
VSRRAIVLAALAAAVMVRPAPALAHTISTDPVSGNYRSRVLSVVPPTPLLRLRVVDGDQRLWMSVASGARAVVLGIQGEQFLRFAGGRVDVNTRSVTASIDRLTPGAPAPSFAASAKPAWRQVASGQAYMWPEHRIGALEPIALHHPGARPTWTLPIVLNGRRVLVTGVLERVSPPSRLLIAGVAAAALALLAACFWRRTAGGRPRMLNWLAAITLVALVVARLGREMYGRPDLGAGNIAELAVTLALGVLAAYLLLRGAPDTRSLVALVVGVVGLYQVARFAAMLTGGLVFSRLPAPVEQAAVALIALAAPATVVLAVRGDLPPVPQLDSRVRTSSATSLGRKGAT